MGKSVSTKDRPLPGNENPGIDVNPETGGTDVATPEALPEVLVVENTIPEFKEWNMELHKMRIKRKALAAEARIIRQDERKFAKRARKYQAKADAYNERREEIHHHRVFHLRFASRNCHLAYCFLKGTPYKKAENKCYSEPNEYEIAREVGTFGPPELRNMELKERRKVIREWLES